MPGVALLLPALLHCPALALPCRWLPLGGAAGQCREEHCTGGRALMGSAGQYSVLAAGTSFDRWKQGENVE